MKSRPHLRKIMIFSSVNLVLRMFFQRLDASEAKKLSEKNANDKKKQKKTGSPMKGSRKNTGNGTRKTAGQTVLPEMTPWPWKVRVGANSPKR